LVIADIFWIVVGLLVLTAESTLRSNRPHIVFILADDVVSLNNNNLYYNIGNKRTEEKKAGRVYLLRNKEGKRFLTFWHRSFTFKF
jgi:hypothetical protein